jgi:DNA repair protein RadD
MLTLRPYQENVKDAVYGHLRTQDDNPCAVVPTGCHAADHPILMYDGTMKKVQDVCVGDRIMGDDSTPRNVHALCRGRDRMYRLTPHRGEPFVVNGSHILSLVSTNEGKQHPSAQKGGENTHVTVKEYLTKSKSWKHLRKLYRVAVEYDESIDLPIPPYILGLLLGDGSLIDGVSLTSNDEELGDEFIRYAHSVGCRVYIHESGGRVPTYRLVSPHNRSNLVFDVLENLGLRGHYAESKFIPHCFLVSSRESRLQLMAGLMDSDGYWTGKDFDYITKSRELADDITMLVRSLGFFATCVEKYCSCQTGAGGWYYRLHISGDCSIVPCRRKRHRKIPARRQKKNVLRSGFTVEPMPEDDYYGFVLDGNHLYVDGHFMVHHNSGKTPIMASICKDAITRWDGRVLILAHVKELLEQAVDKLQTVCPEVSFGVYSAGLKRRDTDNPVIIAGIQSVYKRACELDAFDLVMVDEAHLIPLEGDGMYRQFLSEAKVINPNVRTIGFTATPFRLKTGPICTPDGFLNHVCYDVGIRELIRDGFLCPLVTKAGKVRADTTNLHVRSGEYIPDEVEDLMDQEELVTAACAEIVEQTVNRNATLVFAASVKHGRHIVDVLKRSHCIECGFVCGKTSAGDRNGTLERFKAGQLKYLCNVNVLTTGFDAPNIDCVALVRPTMSPGLYYQMVGRGFRLHPSKDDCLVLDFGGNVLRHGPVDNIQITTMDRGNGVAPAKECPECQSVIAAGYAICPDCGYKFPLPDRGKHEAKASEAGILSGEVTTTKYEVQDITYNVHTKRGASDEDPKSLRVDYRLSLDHWQSEWICFEHDGYARQKAVAWWRHRSPDPVPDTAERSIEIIDGGGLAHTHGITVRAVSGDPYERIIDYQLGPVPEPIPVDEFCGYNPEDIPF